MQYLLEIYKRPPLPAPFLGDRWLRMEVRVFSFEHVIRNARRHAQGAEVRRAQVVVSRMQLNLHATRRTLDRASILVTATINKSPFWLVKVGRAPPRHRRDARVCGHTTTAMYEMSTTPRPPAFPPPPPPPAAPPLPFLPRPFFVHSALPPSPPHPFFSGLGWRPVQSEGFLERSRLSARKGLVPFGGSGPRPPANVSLFCVL